MQFRSNYFSSLTSMSESLRREDHKHIFLYFFSTSYSKDVLVVRVCYGKFLTRCTTRSIIHYQIVSLGLFSSILRLLLQQTASLQELSWYSQNKNGPYLETKNKVIISQK